MSTSTCVKQPSILTSRREHLSDKAYHQIFETLFRVSKAESSKYARIARGPTKAQAASRLSACSSVLRNAVDVGVRKIRSKTVKAVIDHVVQTLPIADDGYCSPLLLDYFKILRTLLEYQPHPEHLSKDAWRELADFCIHTVQDLNRLLSDTDSNLSFRLRNSESFDEDRSRSVTPNARTDPIRKKNHIDPQRAINASLKASTEDIVLCLKHLCSVSNAPVNEKAPATLEAALDFLRMSPNVGHAQQAAFDCIASSLASIVTEDTTLTLFALKSLIPLVCRFWQAKSQALKDSMLIALLHGEPYFGNLARSELTDENQSDLLNLVEIMKDEYCKRADRDRLLLEDVDLSQGSSYNWAQAPFSMSGFRAKFGLLRAEQPWAILHLSAAIIVALDTVERDKRITKDNDDHASKRQKTASIFSDVVLQAKTARTPEKLYAIQILAFVLQSAKLAENGFEETFDVLLSCLSASDEALASWAMLALSR